MLPNVINAYNIPDLLYEGMARLKVSGKQEETRNGPVLALPGPTIISVKNPTERVLFDPIRNANPFFHVMEFVWMMSGSRDVKWLSQFNKNMLSYTDPGGTINHGAYGHRWRIHFSRDQIIKVITQLEENIETRRAVIGMWDPRYDMEPHADLPCNTHIYFRWNVPNDELDMTVCNRSNDFIWGLAGANAVHMTMLHQLICEALGVGIGYYHVMTNNLHIYKDVPEYDYYMSMTGAVDKYPKLPDCFFPFVGEENAAVGKFLIECEDFVDGCTNTGNEWLGTVANPIYYAYRDRIHKTGDGFNTATCIEAPDWRQACLDWIERKESTS